MPEPRGTCREVALPSGETVFVHGAEALSEKGAAALAELVDIVRSRMSEPNPGAADLYRRLDEARQRLDPPLWRHLARQAGVPATVMTRLANGAMPGPGDVEALESWLAAQDPATGPESAG